MEVLVPSRRRNPFRVANTGGGDVGPAIAIAARAP